MIICVCTGQNGPDILKTAEKLRAAKIQAGEPSSFDIEELHFAYGGNPDCARCMKEAAEFVTQHGFDLVPLPGEVSACQSEVAPLTSSGNQIGSVDHAKTAERGR